MARARNQNISPEEYDRWSTPRQALSALKPVSFDAATKAILEHARGGLIRAAARRITFPTANRPPLDYRIIEQAHWHEIRDQDLLNDDFWDTGTAKTFDAATRHLRSSGVGREDDQPEITALGVRFDPDTITSIGGRAAIPRTVTLADAVRRAPSRPATLTGVISTQALSAEKSKPHAGGRPLKPGWEGAINSVWQAIYEGFQPTKQRDIEDRLAQWFTDNDLEEPGPTQRRARAKMIWDAYRSKD